jgi:imidazolonepropionase-like amidohydrolase
VARGVTTEYRGGRWFDGRAFVPRAAWVAGGRFVAAPTGPVEVMDIDGGFVVPAFGEGHTHWLEPDRVETYVADCLRDGICYVKDHATSPRLRARMRLGGPGSVEYVAANQGFTGPGGHPFGLYAELVDAGILDAETAADGGAAFAVATEADVERVWPGFLADRPDFVKVFLVHAAGDGDKQGIDPALVPGIVRRAHAAGLRVAAHIETAYDFHVAVASGVDDVAHLPFVDSADPERYRLADADVARARGMTVATTLQWLDEDAPDVRLDVTRDNVTRLRAAGAVITVGTDIFRATARIEADLLHRYGLLGTTLDLLRAWCVDTPRGCLPHRAVGSLDVGAEATFLVLGGDPLADFAATKDIRLLVQQGVPA